MTTRSVCAIGDALGRCPIAPRAPVAWSGVGVVWEGLRPGSASPGDTAACALGASADIGDDPRPLSNRARRLECEGGTVDDGCSTSRGFGLLLPAYLQLLPLLELDAPEEGCASRDVGRSAPRGPSCCFVLNVVVPLLGSAADKGETLSSAAWPAVLCSLSLGAADTPAVGVVLGSGGNPRKVDRLPLSVLVGSCVISYA